MNELETIGSEKNFKLLLANTYMKQINNFFGEEKQAMRFLSSVMASVQRNPKLLDCTSSSLVNSFMRIAEFRLMPSDLSGEAYIIPYNNKSKGVTEAQFQLGYQGLVTLLYRAGIESIHSDIVRKNDKFSYVNGEIKHEPDIFSDNRGEAIGAYAIIKIKGKGTISKVMKKSEIIGMGQRFSKSYFEYGKKTVGKNTPWNEENDPQLWMWQKTVIKQISKLLPKNSELMEAIGEDTKNDSTIEEEKKRLPIAMKESESLKMGSIKKENVKLYEDEEIPIINIED